MPCGQVVIGAHPTRVTTGPQRGMNLIFQNNAAHAIRVGDDSAVSVTTPAAVNGGTAGKGLLVSPFGSSGGSLATSGAFNLKNWYVDGTTGDVIDYQYTLEE